MKIKSFALYRTKIGYRTTNTLAPPVNDVELLAVGHDIESLRDRWNARQKQMCLKLGYLHKNFHEYIPEPIHPGKTQTHYTLSDTASGFWFTYFVSITELKQWDE